MLNPPFMDLLPRYSELAATWRANDFGQFLAGEEFHETVWEFDSGGMALIFWPFTEVAGWFEFGRTSDEPGAAEVDVAGFADIVELEVVDGDDGVWKC
jgi:hypothetical protein